MKLRALINLLRRTERTIGKGGPSTDVWIGLNGAHGDLLGFDLRNLSEPIPDVFLRATPRSDGKTIQA